MQRLASFVKNVVSNVDDVVDRTLSCTFNRILEPLGTGADFDALDTNRSIMWADLGGTDFDARNECFPYGSVFRANVDLGIFDG